MSERSTAAVPSFVPLPCVCANVRRLARLSTRLYDDALREFGIEVGQFSLLASLARVPFASHGQLSEGLGMESSSLTRNLALLQKRGWVDKQCGDDRRSRHLRLTPEGRVQFRRALPAWRAAQQQFDALFGANRRQALARLLDDASVALNAVPTRSSFAKQRTHRGRPVKRRTRRTGSHVRVQPD